MRWQHAELIPTSHRDIGISLEDRTEEAGVANRLFISLIIPIFLLIDQIAMKQAGPPTTKKSYPCAQRLQEYHSKTGANTAG